MSLVLAFVLCWFFSDFLFDVLRRPVQRFLKTPGGGLIFTAPADQLTAYLQVTFFFAGFLSSPYWLSQIWGFISPGLYKKERALFLIVCFTGTLLFFAGALFAYFVALPLVFSALLNFGGGADQPFITIKNYLSFVFRFVLALGLSFEMPLILFFLCREKILSPQVLKKYRRHAWLALSILSAFMTPPDLLSFFLLWIPLMALYELSLRGVLFFNRKKA